MSLIKNGEVDAKVGLWAVPELSRYDSHAQRRSETVMASSILSSDVGIQWNCQRVSSLFDATIN